MTDPTIRAELASAIRMVNRAFNEVPADRRPDVRVSDVDEILEDALAQPSRRRALEAIEAWRDHYLQLFRDVSR